MFFINWILEFILEQASNMTGSRYLNLPYGCQIMHFSMLSIQGDVGKCTRDVLNARTQRKMQSEHHGNKRNESGRFVAQSGRVKVLCRIVQSKSQVSKLKKIGFGMFWERFHGVS